MPMAARYTGLTVKSAAFTSQTCHYFKKKKNHHKGEKGKVEIITPRYNNSFQKSYACETLKTLTFNFRKRWHKIKVQSSKQVQLSGYLSWFKPHIRAN